MRWLASSAAGDLLHAFIVSSPKTAAVPVDDAAIREQLAKELDRQPWAPRGSINVVVDGGIVDLEGVIRDEWQRAALRIAAENIPGVIQVRDHLPEIDQSAIE
jgi:osmotically-inducible protein OsmY